MTDQPGVNIPQLQLGQVSSTFIHPCLECGTTVQVKDAREQPHEHRVFHKDDSPLAYAWWEGYDAASEKRTITTITELEALPEGAVVLDPLGLSLHRNVDGWMASNGTRGLSSPVAALDALPATVLHVPEAQS